MEHEGRPTSLSMVQNAFQILHANVAVERETWLNQWNQWPDREPFAHPAYLEAFLSKGQQAVCAVQVLGTGGVLLPLILRPIPSLEANSTSSLSDATTPYGYGGAYFWGEVDANKFWDDFDTWAIKKRIVSLFARISLFSESVLPFRGTTRYVMDNIVRSLELDEEAMWMDYEHKVRKNVNKAMRSDVTVVWDVNGSRLEEFQKIYGATMTRREAASSFYFPSSFFEYLIAKCPECLAFVHAIREDRVISTELILIGSNAAYSFLGGTDEENFELRPNDLLKHEIIHWCRAHQKRFFVLGGGLAAEDGLLRYKSSFSPHTGRVPFYVGERTYDEKVNDALISSRKAHSPDWEPAPSFFPAYRSP